MHGIIEYCMILFSKGKSFICVVGKTQTLLSSVWYIFNMQNVHILLSMELLNNIIVKEQY